jgi:hypothetical protein
MFLDRVGGRLLEASLAAALAVALPSCSPRVVQQRQPAPGSPAASAGTSNARQRATADSIDQAQASRFYAALQPREAPLLNAGNYLGVLRLIDSLVVAMGPNEGLKEAAAQMIGTYESFLGQYQEALTAFTYGPPHREHPDTTSFAGYVAEDAVDAIVKRAATQQVVFINEAHHVPRHRAFTLALLPRLRALGFTYFAAEALFESESTLNARKYPVRAIGFYTNEPVFGELVRTAARLGLRLVPYEAVASSQEARETGQARNLVDRILAKDPRARVIVHAGYAHINESGLLAGAKPMAVHFREMTGIDPLTIDQTDMTERGDSLHDDVRYRYIVDHRVLRTAAVLRKGDSLWSSRPGVYDVSVIHPRSVYQDGRPAWLWAVENRRPYTVPENACAPSADCVVEARLVSESNDAVPIDRLRIGSGGTSRTLALPPGEYVITVRDGTGSLLSERRIAIDR